MKAQNVSPASKGSFLRVVLWLVLLIISIAIIIPVAAFLIFNPNDYKQEVSAFITEKSGLPLEIHGNIEMKYFPHLALNVADVQLSQAPGFGDGEFIKIEHMTFKLPVRELLDRQLIIETLTLKGLQINLVKNSDGSTNWDYFTNQVKKTTSKKSVSTEDKPASSTDSKQKKKLTFSLVHFDVQDANFSFEDKAQQEIIQLRSLQIKGERGDKENDYPISGQFDVTQQLSKSKATSLSGHTDFKGTMTFAKKITATLDTTMTLAFPNNPSNFQKANLAMNINVDADKAISLKDIRLQVGEQTITGTSMIPADGNAPITFKLKMNRLDLDKLAPAPSAPESAPQSSSNATPLQTTTAQSTTVSKNSVSNNKSSRSINGDIQIQQVLVKNLTLDNVKASIRKDNNLLKVSSLTASLYQGTLSLVASKDLANAQAATTVQGTLKDIQIQPLLTDLKQEKRLTGRADLDFNLAQNSKINGIVKAHITNGTIEGIDVKYYLSLAASLFNKEKKVEADTNTTPFGDLTATLNINDDIIYNNDLTIVAPSFKANGDGSINLANKTIEYKMQAYRQYKDNEEHPNAYPLAIRIKGALNHPKVEPDMDLYLKKGLEKDLKKELNKQIEKNLGKILGNKSDPNQTTQEGSTPSTDELQQKLEEKLNKGLNKLFKKKKKDE